MILENDPAEFLKKKAKFLILLIVGVDDGASSLLRSTSIGLAIGATSNFAWFLRRTSRGGGTRARERVRLGNGETIGSEGGVVFKVGHGGW